MWLYLVITTVDLLIPTVDRLINLMYQAYKMHSPQSRLAGDLGTGDSGGSEV